MGPIEDFRQFGVSGSTRHTLGCSFDVEFDHRDLGLLKRDKKLQIRYMAWSEGIKAQYGSMGKQNNTFMLYRTMRNNMDWSLSTVDYLLSYRLRWGQPDTLSIIPSRLDPPRLHRPPTTSSSPSGITTKGQTPNLPPIPSDAPPYFTADTSPELISIIMNDWPYSGIYLYLFSDHLNSKRYCNSLEAIRIQYHRR